MERTDHWQQSIRLGLRAEKAEYPFPEVNSTHMDFVILIYIITLLVHSSIYDKDKLEKDTVIHQQEKLDSILITA